MIAVQLYYQNHVEEELKKFGCSKVEQIDEELGLWVTPWDFYFTVPELGPDKMCPRSVLFELLADIERSRPTQQ
jgi:hypothetical protein